jgi:hypothetical protein
VVPEDADAFVARLQAAVADASPEERQVIVRMLVDKVQIRGDRMAFVLAFSPGSGDPAEQVSRARSCGQDASRDTPGSLRIPVKLRIA